MADEYKNQHFSEASEPLCLAFSSLSEESSPETLELFLTDWRFFLPIIEPSLSSESANCFLCTTGEYERDFLETTLFGLAELDFDLLLFEDVLLRLVERVAWDVPLLPLTADWFEVIEPARDTVRAEPADTFEATLEALLPDREWDPDGDFEWLLDGDAEPDRLLERDLDVRELGSDPEGVWTLAGDTDLDDWLLLFADDELDTDSESLASE